MAVLVSCESRRVLGEVIAQYLEFSGIFCSSQPFPNVAMSKRVCQQKKETCHCGTRCVFLMCSFQLPKKVPNLADFH